MSQGDRDREDRAFEALIVYRIRRERDPRNLEDLPELDEDERAAMEAMPDDLVEKLWNEVESGERTSPVERNKEDVLTADEERYAAMNRGDGLPEDTYEKLDDARKDVVDELKKARQPKEDDDAKS